MRVGQICPCHGTRLIYEIDESYYRNSKVNLSKMILERHEREIENMNMPIIKYIESKIMETTGKRNRVRINRSGEYIQIKPKLPGVIFPFFNMPVKEVQDLGMVLY